MHKHLLVAALFIFVGFYIDPATPGLQDVSPRAAWTTGEPPTQLETPRVIVKACLLVIGGAWAIAALLTWYEERYLVPPK